MLVGSAASAIHGVHLQPGDVDVLAHTAADVSLIAAVLPLDRQAAAGPAIPQTFVSSQSRPVLRFGDGAWTLARWLIDGTKVEVAHIAGDDGLLEETKGSAIWRHRQWVTWHGHQLPIVPLEVQLATMLRRDQTRRSRATAAHLQKRGHDRSLLTRALSDQGIDSSVIAIS